MSRYTDNARARAAGWAAMLAKHNTPIISTPKPSNTMAYEKREGDIRISPNTYKNSDRQPDYRGTALLGGKEYRISLWRRENERGEWFSGVIEEAPETEGTQLNAPHRAPRTAQAPAPAPEPAPVEDPENDLPF